MPYTPNPWLNEMDDGEAVTVAALEYLDERTAARFTSVTFFDQETPVTVAATLTAEDEGTVDTTYGQDEVDVIDNLRTRLGELEAHLIALGLLAAPE